MGYLRVAYVIEDLKDPKKDYRRDIETFPLQMGKYRLKKHPLFSFWIVRYEHNTLTFSVKNEMYDVKVNQYMYFTYKTTKTKKVDVFFEIMDEEWVDEVKEEEELPSLDGVSDAKLLVHLERYARDIYSESTKEQDYEIPLILNESIDISIVNGKLFVKRIISEDEVLMSVNGHYGKDFIVTSEKEGIFKAGDSYGHNDNFYAFSCKITVKLVKK